MASAAYEATRVEQLQQRVETNRRMAIQSAFSTIIHIIPERTQATVELIATTVNHYNTLLYLLYVLPACQQHRHCAVALKPNTEGKITNLGVLRKNIKNEQKINKKRGKKGQTATSMKHRTISHGLGDFNVVICLGAKHSTFAVLYERHKKGTLWSSRGKRQHR